MAIKTKLTIYSSITMAFSLWYLIFVARPLNFWLMMSFATVLLALVSFAAGRPLFRRDEFTFKNILLGIASAAFLYFVFFAGRKLLPIFIPHDAQNLHSIYANAESIPLPLVAALLFFPIGFGEEIFWRGFIQKKFGLIYGKKLALILTVLIYTAVHIPTMNPVLILAAAVCGAFWGLLYFRTESLLVVLVSHMCWDPLVFIVRPIM